jgi:hypothetical protein
VHLIATIALDLLLALTLLVSVQIAAGWGELCGIRPGRDKSGLGGFTMLFALFGCRWVVLAVCLLCVAPTGARVWTLVGHTVLGFVSARIFSRGVDRVHEDGTVANAIGLLGSTLIPAPAWTLAVHGANANWLGDSPASFVAVGVVVALLHALPHELRRRSTS